MLKVSGMAISVRKAGTASERSFQRIRAAAPIISTPVTTSAGAAAKVGTD